MSLIYDDLMPGDYFLFEGCVEWYEGLQFPLGEPMLVRGVSLPWVTFSPVSKPFMLYPMSLESWAISIPSEEYINAWKTHFWEAWVAYTKNMEDGLAAYQQMDQQAKQPQNEQS
jgi:hypothetical protein